MLLCGVGVLHCILAEWTLVRPRLWRTPFGVWLAALGAGIVWLQLRAGHPDALTAALQAGALGAVLGAAYGAGGALDHAAFALALSHPTSPLGIAVGRWLAAVLPAATLALVCALALGGGGPAMLAGAISAAAVAGCALAAVLVCGNAAAFLLFLYMALAGSIAPERLVALADPGVLRVSVASVLELAPALWRYRAAAGGDAGAIAHALAWAALGIVLAGGLVRWRASHDGLRTRAV